MPKHALACAPCCLQSVNSQAPLSQCPQRPPTGLYAPARAHFLHAHAPSEQGFSVVVSFGESFDLRTGCTDARYSCVLGVEEGGVVREGSAQQLDAAGTLYRVSGRPWHAKEFIGSCLDAN